MGLTGTINHRYIYFFGLVLLAIALPVSNFLMSVSQIILIANWVLEGNFQEKFSTFRQNKTALVVSGVFVLHLAGLLYTSDFTYAAEDLRKKMPLVLLPLIISTSPSIPRVWFERLMAFFITSVFVATIISTAVLFGYTGKQILDVRHISLFISHIRFSLMICLAFFISVYYAFVKRGKIASVLLPLALWFVVFLSLMESVTGLAIIGLGLFALLLYFSFEFKNRAWKAATVVILLAMPLLLGIYLYKEVKAFYRINPVDFSKLEAYSPRGEKYLNDTLSKEMENGNYIRLYIAWDELYGAWNKRSAIPIDSADMKGHPVKITLLRFLTSKGLRKDADGVNSLTDDEIHSIEKGIANVNYQDVSSMRNRVRQIIWEVDSYNNGVKPNGHSLTMRLEFWRAAIGIIKDNLLFGVGTGDVRTSFDEQYKKIRTPLDMQWRLRAHNQFLEIAVAFGVFGLIYFMFSLAYPFITDSSNFNYLYLLFMLISLFSMLSEDTLETQAGVTFFAFFNSLFLFGRKM